MNTQNTTPTRKILVVDDDPRLRDLLRRYLSEQGFNVFVAEDAKEMGKLWQREHFDLLVLDLMLPGEDGLSICRRLRGGHDNTPITVSYTHLDVYKRQRPASRRRRRRQSR